jgi:SepF-like predicted cell division protein (DUF552 family)
LASANLGKVIDKIVSKVKREEEQPTEKPLPEIPATQPPEPIPVSSPPPLPPKTVYIKTLKLNSLEELEKIKSELESGNIVIVRLTPLFDKDLDDVKRAVRNLTNFTKKFNGDIASLGEDRVIVTPTNVKIWREGNTESK